MKSLKDTLKENTIKTFTAGCNIALHCNGNLKEMEIVGKIQLALLTELLKTLFNYLEVA